MEGFKFALLFCLLAVYWSWDGVSAATTKAAAKATTKAAAKATTKKPTVKATTTKLPPLLLTNQKVTTKYPSLLGFAAAEEEEDNIFTMVKTTAKPNNQRTTVRYIDNDGMSFDRRYSFLMNSNRPTWFQRPSYSFYPRGSNSFYNDRYWWTNPYFFYYN